MVSMFSPLSVIRLGSPGSSQTLSPSQGSGFNHSSSLRTFRSSESLCRVHHKLWRHHTSTVGSVLVSSFLSPPVCFSHDFSSSDESGKVDHTSVYASFFSLFGWDLQPPYLVVERNQTSPAALLSMSHLSLLGVQKLKAGR